MRKKYSTLTEEINRMKSLFTEERLYGNIVEKQLLTEGNVFKYLGKAFANSSAPAVKSLGHIRVNKAFSSAIDNFAGLSKHLDDFDDVWKAMGLTGDELRVSKGTIKNLGDLESSGVLSKFDIYREVNGFRPIETISTKGGLRETVMLKYWDDTGIKPPSSQYTSPPSKIDNPSTVTWDGSGLIRLTDSDGVVKTLDGGSGGGKVETFTPTKTETKESFAARVNKSVDWGSGAREMTVADVNTALADGKKLLVVVEDGKWQAVRETSDGYLTLGPKGEIISDIETSKKILPKIKKKTWQWFRYIFPTYSSLGKIVNRSLGGSKLHRTWWDSDRISVMGGLEDGFWVRKGKFAENLVRVIAIEQTALMTINYGKKSIERGELGNLTAMWNDYFSGEDTIGTFNVSYLLGIGAGQVWESLKDMRENGLAVCRTNCDNEVIAHKLEVEADEDIVENPDLYDNCFEDCEKSVNDFFDKLDEFKKSMEDSRKLFDKYDLMEIENWDENQINDYCNNKDNRKTDINASVEDVKTKMKKIESEIDERFRESGWMSAVKWVLNWVVEVDGIEKLKKSLFNTDVDGEAQTSGGIGVIQKQLTDVCTKVANPEGDDNNIITPDEEDDNEGEGTILTDEKIKKLYGQITVEIEPIQLSA